MTFNSMILVTVRSFEQVWCGNGLVKVQGLDHFGACYSMGPGLYQSHTASNSNSMGLVTVNSMLVCSCA